MKDLVDSSNDLSRDLRSHYVNLADSIHYQRTKAGIEICRYDPHGNIWKGMKNKNCEWRRL